MKYLFLLTDTIKYYRVLFGLNQLDTLVITYIILREQYGIYDQMLEQEKAKMPFSKSVMIEEYARDPFAASIIYASVSIPPGATEVCLELMDDTLIVNT